MSKKIDDATSAIWFVWPFLIIPVMIIRMIDAGCTAALRSARDDFGGLWGLFKSWASWWDQ